MAVKLTVLWLVLVIAICVAGARWKGRKDEKLHWGSKLKVNAWQSITNEPQQSDFPEVPYLSSRPNTAIGFTGGGARAFVSAIGQLAALNQLGLMKNVRYIGGISGGAWATTSYTYAQNIASDEEYLGEIVDPKDITYEGLQVMSPSCARGFALQNLTLVGLQAYYDGLVETISDGWTYGVYKLYMEPAGISPDTYFSWNEEVVSDIKSRNSVLKDATFILPSNSERPYMILGTTLSGPVEGGPYDEATQNFTLLELTPLYVGQFKKQSVAYKYNLGLTHHRTVGGAIEPFAFSKHGSDSPLVGLASDHTSGSLSVSLPDEPFDVIDAASLSSYAAGTFVESLPGNTSEFLGMQFDYWSPSDLIPSGIETYFGDGGSYENIPLISFLQRRVEKIVLFFNSETTLQPADKWDVASNLTYDGQVTDCLSAFFGVLEESLPWYGNRSFSYEKDQVYSQEDYVRVIQGLQAAQAQGNGMVATFELTTIENAWWGIPAGITSQVTFVYLGRLSGWEAQLSTEMQGYLVPSDPDDAADLSVDVDSGPFAKFPNFYTTGGSISYEKANALADLTGWAVLQNSATFQAMLS